MRTFEEIGNIAINALLSYHCSPERMKVSKEATVRLYLKKVLSRKKYSKNSCYYLKSLLQKATSSYSMYNVLSGIAENYTKVISHDKKFDDICFYDRFQSLFKKMRDLGYELHIDIEGDSLFLNENSKAMVIFKNDYINLEPSGDLTGVIYVTVVNKCMYDFIESAFNSGLYPKLFKESSNVSKFEIHPNNNPPAPISFISTKEDYLHKRRVMANEKSLFAGKVNPFQLKMKKS
ncbi:hypothetical protein [Vibrio sp. Vb0587]|uniref:hypothetical protein n=1 Tax=Vibrio sp. Vb0587 TaxID=3074626 RepID=UPI002964E0D6|nr:hypothetical protein [Vibrio sp. Vb0587]MDW1963951.1 hypothetical protein [Vibrio sp. Vb0587]